MIEAMKLGMAIYKRLSYSERKFGTDGKKEVLQKLRKAIGDDSKVSILEWSTIGKYLGVFETKQYKE